MSVIVAFHSLSIIVNGVVTVMLASEVRSLRSTVGLVEYCLQLLIGFVAS